jgi:uncharacterized damage-inducible protein DinB
MPITDLLLPEYDHEMGTTRRVLDRVPEAEFAWKPHVKSMSLGQLAGHLANLPIWATWILDTEELDLLTLGDDSRPRLPRSRAALLQEFDEKVATARRTLAARTDAELVVPWTLKRGEHEIFTLPRIAALRGFVMNHSIHHRGQLTVYLRLKDVLLPPVYGPTADEQ